MKKPAKDPVLSALADVHARPAHWNYLGRAEKVRPEPAAVYQDVVVVVAPCVEIMVAGNDNQRDARVIEQFTDGVRIVLQIRICVRSDVAGDECENRVWRRRIGWRRERA